MFVLKNAAACLAGGVRGWGGQEWEKCARMVHGKFLHCLQLQSHSKTVRSPVIPAEERTRVILRSHHWQGSDSERCWGEIPLSKRPICFNLEGQKKNQISITALKISKAVPLNWNSLLAFIQRELWFKGKKRSHTEERELKGLTCAGVRGGLWSAGVSEEALLAVLAVPALRVMAAVVAHTTTPPSCCEPQSPAEVTALGVTVTLAL